MFPEFIKVWYLNLITPLSDYLVKGRVRPNVLTAVGFLLGVAAGYAFARGALGVAGFLVLVSGVFDTLDGKVARANTTPSPFGSFLDSTVDRFSELAVGLGLLAYYLQGNQPWMGYVVFALAGGSLMVSYTRAKAESLGLSLRIGWAQRAERVVLLSLGALLGPWPLAAAIMILALLSNLTALQRIMLVWKAVEGK